MQISLRAWPFFFFSLCPAAQPFFETLLQDVIVESMSLEKVSVEIWPISGRIRSTRGRHLSKPSACQFGRPLPVSCRGLPAVSTVDKA